MKIQLIFADWIDNATGKSIYNTKKGIDLSTGDFHSGTTFDAEVEFDEENAADLEAALEAGFVPIFEVRLP